MTRKAQVRKKQPSILSFLVKRPDNKDQSNLPDVSERKHDAVSEKDTSDSESAGAESAEEIAVAKRKRKPPRKTHSLDFKKKVINKYQSDVSRFQGRGWRKKLCEEFPKQLDPSSNADKMFVKRCIEQRSTILSQLAKQGGAGSRKHRRKRLAGGGRKVTDFWAEVGTRLHEVIVNAQLQGVDLGYVSLTAYGATFINSKSLEWRTEHKKKLNSIANNKLWNGLIGNLLV